LFIGDKDYFEKLTFIQNSIIEQIKQLNPKNIINVSAVGTGKTLTTAKILQNYSGNSIVASPKNITKQWNTYFDNAVIYDAIKNKLNISLNWQANSNLIIGKEYFAKKLNDNKQKKATVNYFAKQYNNFVIDESHRQSRKSISFKRFSNLPINHKILLSATPEFNAPLNLYKQLTQFFNLNISYNWFENNCVKLKQITRPAQSYDYQKIKQGQLFSFKSKQGQTFVKDYVIDGWTSNGKELLLGKAECVIDIQNKKLPYENIIIRVDISPIQRKMYDELLAQSFTQARGGHGELLATLPITLRIRLRQILLAEPQLEWQNSLKDEVYFDESSKSSKFDEIKHILENEPNRLIIWTDSKQFAQMCEKKHSRIKAFTGGMTAKQSQQLESWFTSTHNAVLAIVYTAGSEGLDTFKDVCNTEIIANIADGRLGATMEQASGRLNRTGSPFDFIKRYWLIADNTFEGL
jgi:superfamily II DNA or RNA helicase